MAYFQLGVLEKKLGNSSLAIQYLNKVLNIKADHDKTWFTLGTVFESDDHLDSAIVLAEMGRGNNIRAKKHFEIAHKDRNWRKLSERKIDEINNPAKYEK